MPTVRIQEKNYSESIMVLKLKDGNIFKTDTLRRDIVVCWNRCSVLSIAGNLVLFINI